MSTFVGIEEDFYEALENLMELDYAAAVAYQEAIESLENEKFKQQIEVFKRDNDKHIEACHQLLKKNKKELPVSSDIKQFFTQGRVIFDKLMSDEAILEALKLNEEDIKIAYERLNEHPRKTEEASDLLAEGLKDEEKHRDWLEQTLRELENLSYSKIFQ